MKYLWTEDTGAGLHFWKLVNQLFFEDEFIVEGKGSNQGLLDAVLDLEIRADDKYYIAFDYVVDNQDKPEVKGGDEKMRMLIQSEEVQRVLGVC